MNKKKTPSAKEVQTNPIDQINSILELYIPLERNAIITQVNKSVAASLLRELDFAQANLDARQKELDDFMNRNPSMLNFKPRLTI